MPPVKDCLILAAGNGSRIASLSGGVPKPLVPLFGVPILEHILMASQAAGINRFVIVVGYRADLIRSWFANRSIAGISVTFVENRDYHKANGVSALAAKEQLRSRFLMLMADHIFEAKTAQALLEQPLAGDEVLLAVDPKVERIFDLADATKVRREGNHIVDIGKDLARYDALDTGMFLCGPALFNSLESARRDGNCSLSDGMRRLASMHQLRAFEVGNAHWQDIDTPEAFAHTKNIFERDFLQDRAAECLAHV